MRNRNTREQAMRLYLPDESTEGLEERVQALQDGLKDLKPPICRDIVLMHYRDGMTFKEIAAHFGVSETTIYKHLREAMNQLRLTLKQLG
jgi:RNA polymerase sigma-70 factor (ECF subfamily)